MTQSGDLRKRKGGSPTPNKTTKETKIKKPSKQKQTYSGDIFRRCLAYLFEEEDASYLAIFRILWGSIMAYESYTYMIHDFGKMYGSFYSSIIQFKYYGFEWCEVPADPLVTKIAIIVMFMSGLFLTIGFFYRTSSVIFFLIFTYLYMLEQAMYLNHFYLVCVLSFMMIILPCNCYFSVDALLWPDRVYSPTCPKWCLIFVRAELAIVYTYAGICKINEDWLRGEPLRDWMANRQNTPLIGPLLVRESTAYFMSYAGLIYDLIIAELLAFKITLPLGIALSLFFHISNKIVFNIGIFPWMMIASTTFYFDADWPRKLVHKLKGGKGEYIARDTNNFSQTKGRSLSILEWIIVIGLVVFIIHQVFIPLRLHTYPGTVAWNEYGHQFSWRMKLRTKRCDAHALSYHPETHFAYQIHLEELLNRRQYRKMASRPDMIIQMAHFLRDTLDDQVMALNPNVTTGHEIYIESWCQLNGREWQQFTNNTYDLAQSEKWVYPYPWVTEVKPLTDEQKANYPWNFEWNFNWLKGIDRLPPNPRANHDMRGKQMQQDAWIKWKEWLQERDPLVKFRTLNQ